MRNLFLTGARTLSLMVLLNVSVKAQENIGNIGTERPTISTTSHTIAKNAFQFEQGFTYMNNDLLYDGLFRLAVSEIAEIRLLTSYVANSTYFGAKVNLLKQTEYKPGVSIQATFSGITSLADFRVSWAQKITNNISSTLNVGKGQNYYIVLALGYSFSEKTNVFIEGYYDDLIQQFDAGVTYLINSETQVDLSGGVLNGGQAYIGVGVARRFLLKNHTQ